MPAMKVPRQKSRKLAEAMPNAAMQPARHADAGSDDVAVRRPASRISIAAGMVPSASPRLQQADRQRRQFLVGRESSGRPARRETRRWPGSRRRAPCATASTTALRLARGSSLGGAWKDVQKCVYEPTS